MVLTETITSVALVTLTKDLGIFVPTAQWLTTGHLLTMAIAIPTTGYLLQRFTTRQVFITAMALFCLGTLIAALSMSFAPLLTGRIVQAAAGGVRDAFTFGAAQICAPRCQQPGRELNGSNVIASTRTVSTAVRTLGRSASLRPFPR